MRILFFGSGEFALPTLRSLVDRGHEVPLIVTQPAKPSGRGRRTKATPVHDLAEELGIELIEPKDVNVAEIVNRIKSLDAQLGVVVAFGQKLGPGVLQAMPGGCVNLHASLLPALRGAAPIHWAIVRGKVRTGCTVFRIVKRMDAGAILAQCETQIDPRETTGMLHDRLAKQGVEAVHEAVAQFEDGEIPSGTPQDDALATTAPKLKKADGFIHFDRPTQEVYNRIRGMTPWPGAAAQYESDDGRWEKITITRARIVEDALPYEMAGTLDEHLHITTNDGVIEIVELKPSSGRVMDWKDYVNGRHVSPGDMLTAPTREKR
jgi:methionyl-tRNA formyltransferase